MPARLFSPAEAEKLAQLQQADTEGRKQAHIDAIFTAIKTAARAQAWASQMGLEKDAFPLAAQAKAVGGAVQGAGKKVLSLIRGGGKKAIQTAAKPALTAIEGGAARGASHVMPPPAGSMRPGAAEAAMRRAPATPPPIPAQAAGPTPGTLHPAIQPMQGVRAPQVSLEKSIGGLSPYQQAEISLNKGPGQLQFTSHSPAPTATAHASDPAMNEALFSSRVQGMAPPQKQGFFAKRRAAREATGKARAEIASATPTAQSAGTVAPAPQAAPTQAAAKSGKLETAPAEATPKSKGGPTPREQLRRFGQTAQRGLDYAGKTVKGLGYGAALGAGVLGYGAYKMAPHVVGALGQAASQPMAPGGGWSPVDYGYGSNPYGAGVPY